MGSHQDTTYRRRAATLVGRVLGLLAAFLVVMALPLDFAGKLRVLRTKFLPGALHAIEASRIAFSLPQRPRTAFVSAVWSKKMPLAHIGAILSLLDGPPGCDPGFYVVWVRFRLLRRYLAYNPLEVPRLYGLLALVAAVGPGHGPMHLLVESSGVLGFTWDTLNFGWTRPGLPMLHQLAGPYQHFKAATWEAWRAKVSFDYCRRQGFRGGPDAGHCWLFSTPTCLTCKRKGQGSAPKHHGWGRLEWISSRSCQGRNRSMPLLRRVLMEMGTSFGNVLTSPLVQIRENPGFHVLIQRD